jgi:predicted transcriptional regulator
LTESVGTARQRAEQLAFTICPVVNEGGFVLGLIREEGWQADPGTPAEQVMESGPTTLRPSATIDEAMKHLDKNGWSAILVTSSDGKLLGIFRRQAAGSDTKKQVS